MTQAPADALEPWSLAGATGALRLLGPHGGAIYLAHGRITYAECPLTCGVSRMLTATGRASAEAVRAAISSGRGDGPAAGLIHAGLLTPIEAETLFLSAVYSAVYVMFEAHAEAQFEVGAGHALAGAVAIDLTEARAEIDRRRDAMHAAWPYASVDTSPVVPARRIDGHQVALTALQWEIAVSAGRRRTPIDLARRLGRDTYATMLAVRRMVGAGLIQAPPVIVTAEVPAQVTLDVPVRQRTIRPATAKAPADQSAPVIPRPPATPRTPARGRKSAPAPAPLPRRDAGVAMSERATDDGWTTVDVPGLPSEWSDSELLRIRDALQAMR